MEPMIDAVKALTDATRLDVNVMFTATGTASDPIAGTSLGNVTRPVSISPCVTKAMGKLEFQLDFDLFALGFAKKASNISLRCIGTSATDMKSISWNFQLVSPNAVVDVQGFPVTIKSVSGGFVTSITGVQPPMGRLCDGKLVLNASFGTQAPGNFTLTGDAPGVNVTLATTDFTLNGFGGVPYPYKLTLDRLGTSPLFGGADVTYCAIAAGMLPEQTVRFEWSHVGGDNARTVGAPQLPAGQEEYTVRLPPAGGTVEIICVARFDQATGPAIESAHAAMDVPPQPTKESKARQELIDKIKRETIHHPHPDPLRDPVKGKPTPRIK